MDLAAEWAGFKTIGQCEWADYPTKVLEKHWPDVPRWKDIRTLTKESFYERTGRRTADIISGGFPCQPFSVAGKRRGKEDDRYLWPEMVRVIKELRPAWVVGENVAGIVRMELPGILSELEACGYRTRTFLVPACAVKARHRRYRVAIVAHTTCEQNRREEQQEFQSRTGAGGEDVHHTYSAGCQEQHAAAEPDKKGFSGGGCSAGNVCNAAGQGLPDGAGKPLAGQKKEQKPERPDIHVSDTDDGLRKWSHKEIQTRGNATYGSSAREWKRTTESVLGGMAYGLPGGLDGDLDFLINHYWDVEPDIPRLASGVEHRADRLKALGNAVVPQQFYPFFRYIREIESGI